MISVLNRQRPLSGNRIVTALCFLLLLSCGTSKKGIKSGTRSDTVKKDQKKSSDTSSKVDTVQWSTPIDNEVGPITDTTAKGEVDEVMSTQDYNIGFVLPITDIESPLNQRYIQALLGAKIAASKKNDGDSYIKVNVLSNNNMVENGAYDCIITPNDKATVKKLADYGKEEKILVVSPWYSNSKTTTHNPFYLQLTPNVREHFNKIISHAASQYEPGEVALIGVESRQQQSMNDYFQEIGKVYFNKENPFVEHFVQEDSLALGEMVYHQLFEDGVKAFIIPNFSARDEAMVYGALRRLNAEKAYTDILTYCMPFVLESDRIGFDYYYNLNIRIPVAAHIEDGSYEVESFRRTYYQEYGGLPSEDAYYGYDLINFIVDNLASNGKSFPSKINGDNQEYLITSFNIQPVSIDEKMEATSVDFYENKNLYLIGYKEGSFAKMD